MSEPFEIMAAPFTAWWAPVGEAFPLIDADPAGNWMMIGTSGSRNITEDGVVVTHEQTIEEFRMLGGTGPIKASRTEEGLIIAFALADLTLENYRLALNNNTVATDVGPPSIKEIPMYRGHQVAQMALLLRGIASPYIADGRIQYEVPRCYVAEAVELTHTKGEPAALSLTFHALEDLAAATEGGRFGRIVALNT